eukprot:g5513.t1
MTYKVIPAAADEDQKHEPDANIKIKEKILKAALKTQLITYGLTSGELEDAAQRCSWIKLMTDKDGNITFSKSPLEILPKEEGNYEKDHPEPKLDKFKFRSKDGKITYATYDTQTVTVKSGAYAKDAVVKQGGDNKGKVLAEVTNGTTVVVDLEAGKMLDADGTATTIGGKDAGKSSNTSFNTLGATTELAFEVTKYLVRQEVKENHDVITFKGLLVVEDEQLKSMEFFADKLFLDDFTTLLEEKFWKNSGGKQTLEILFIPPTIAIANIKNKEKILKAALKTRLITYGLTSGELEDAAQRCSWIKLMTDKDGNITFSKSPLEILPKEEGNYEKDHPEPKLDKFKFRSKDGKITYATYDTQTVTVKSGAYAKDAVVKQGGDNKGKVLAEVTNGTTVVVDLEAGKMLDADGTATTIGGKDAGKSSNTSFNTLGATTELAFEVTKYLVRQEVKENHDVITFKGLLVVEDEQLKSMEFFEDKLKVNDFKISHQQSFLQNLHLEKPKEQTMEFLFIPPTIEKTIYGNRYYVPRESDLERTTTSKENSICGSYDPISNRLRYWWSEHKCYRYFLIFFAVHTTMFLIYLGTSLALRNQEMHDLKWGMQPTRSNETLNKEFANIKNVYLNVSNLDCKVIFTSVQSKEMTSGRRYVKTKVDIPLLEWPGTYDNASFGYTFHLGRSLKLIKKLVQDDSYLLLQPYQKTKDRENNTLTENLKSNQCILYFMVQPNRKLNFIIETERDSTIDMEAFNFSGEDIKIHVKRKANNNLETTSINKLSVTSIFEKSKFQNVVIDSDHVALQMIDVSILTINVTSDKGWIDMKSNINSDLFVANNTGKCLKGKSVLEKGENRFQIFDSAENTFSSSFASFDIRNGVVYYTRKTKVKPGQETKGYSILKRIDNALGNNYNISRDEIELSKNALETIHPVLKLIEFDIRSPNMDDVTFFASHPMVFRLRPEFLSLVSVGLLMAKKQKVKLHVTDSPCLSSYEKKMCKFDEAGTSKNKLLNCVVGTTYAIPASNRKGDQGKKMVYNDFHTYLRKTFFLPLKSLEKEKEWITRAGYENYIFAAQTHRGKHMFDLMAWTYDSTTEKFLREEPINPRPIGVALIILSSGICVFLLAVFAVTIGIFIGHAETEVIASTLFNDPEFLLDMTHIMSSSKSQLKQYIGAKGLEETEVWKLSCLCCRSRARCSCDYRCCTPICDDPKKLKTCCLNCCCFTASHYYMKIHQDSFERSSRSRKCGCTNKSICCCFKRCCGLGYVSTTRKTKISDVANTKSHWFENLRNLIDVFNKTDLEESHNTVHRNTFNHSVNRLIQKAALVQSFTDLMFFIEMYFPNQEMQNNPSAEEVIYTEMTHETIEEDIFVVFAQITTVAFLVVPAIVLAIFWSGLETYYYSGLADNNNHDNGFYSSAMLHVPLPNIGGGYGYLQLSPPSIIVLGIVIVYLILEMYSFFDTYVLHSTKFEAGEYKHRLLEWRIIFKEQQNRHMKFRGKEKKDEYTFYEWADIPADRIKVGPPLKNGHKHCP